MIRKIFTVLVSLFMTTIYSQNDTIKSLDEVTINGIRSTKNTPVTQKTIFRDEIQKTYQGFEVSTLLNKTPNATMSTDNGTPFGYTYFRIRGIDQTRINMTLNGVPLNEPEDQGVFFSNYPNFLDNIQSVEIQRGVGTSTNGVSSFAGSINFISPNGIDKGGNIRYTSGSFNSTKISSSYSTGLSSKKLALYTNASIYQTDGYRYGSGGNGKSLFLSGGYFGEDNKLKFTGFIGNSKNGMAWQPVSEDEVNDDPKTNYNENDAWDNFTQSFIQLEYSSKINLKSNLTTSVFYNKLNGGYDYAMNGTRNLFLQSNFYGVVSNFNYKGETTKLDFGISANTYNRFHDYSYTSYLDENNNQITITDPLNNNKGTKQELSSYLKVSQQFKKLILTLDLQNRYASFNYDGVLSTLQGTWRYLPTVNWTFFNPKGGLVYNFTNRTSLYSTIGQSFREPTRTNMFMGSDWLVYDNNRPLFNNIKPEKVVDYELGLRHHTDRLTLQANLFYMDFTNEILPSGGTTPSSVGNAVSCPSSYRKGLELDIKYNISKNLTLDYNQSLTYTKFENIVINNEYLEEGQAILTPRNISAVTLTYTNCGFQIGLNSKIQSSSYLDLTNKNKIDGFTVLNSFIGYSDNKFSILLSLNNLTSEEYYTNGSMLARDFSISNRKHLFTNPPINGFLTINYKL